MRNKSRFLLLAILVAVGVAASADAQGQSDEWQFQLAPLYLWAMSVDGTMTFRDRASGEFEVDFKDAFDNLETAFTIHFEAGKGRWRLLADASYLNLGDSEEIPTPGGTADIEIKNLILEGGFGYEVTNQLWIIAGVRYFELDTEIGFELAPSIAPSESWFDLYGGLMWRPKLGKRWTFASRLDAGFGGSDLTWNAAAAIDFRLGKWAAVFAGYRHLQYDYRNQNTGIKYDLGISGPVAAFRFFW